MARLLLILALALWPAVGNAAVKLSFYSHDFGQYYPHAFIVVQGTTLATGEEVNATYGWSSAAANVVLALGGRTRGLVNHSSPTYVSDSTEEFSIYLTDAEYSALRARIEAWANLPQPSYSLADANCIHFVADMALAVGLKVDKAPGLMLKPKSYLLALRAANQAQIATRAIPPASEPGPHLAAAPLAQTLINDAAVVY